PGLLQAEVRTRRLSRRWPGVQERSEGGRAPGAGEALAPLPAPRLRLAADREGAQRRVRLAPARALQPADHAPGLRASLRAGRPRGGGKGGAGGELHCDGRRARHDALTINTAAAAASEPRASFAKRRYE